MSNPSYIWTYSEYARFPDDGNRYEVIDGEVLVTPAPSPHHQRILFALGRRLQEYVERNDLGEILLDVDLLFVSGQFVRPDLLFVPKSAKEAVTDRGMERAPGLIVEIQSPTSSSIDRVRKPRRYGDFGVPEYWVVDPTEAALLVWRFAAGEREPNRATDIVHWQPDAGIAPLQIACSDLFRRL
ncbi:MAG: Uma2 family endonuclease [Gemmatimonadota bacterium]